MIDFVLDAILAAALFVGIVAAIVFLLLLGLFLFGWIGGRHDDS